MADVATEGRPVLLCSYDYPLPPPLDASARPSRRSASALVLVPDDAPGVLARVTVEYTAGRRASGEPRAETLRPSPGATPRRARCDCWKPWHEARRIRAPHCPTWMGSSPCEVTAVLTAPGDRLAGAACRAPCACSTGSLSLGRGEHPLRAPARISTPQNPLRRAGRLAAVCGLEYGLQAAALHGALAAGGRPQPAGYVAALRDVALHVARLDDPAHGELRVTAVLEQAESAGLLYALRIDAEHGAPLAAARAVIALPRGPA